MKNVLLILIVVATLCFACTDRDDNLANANIRIRITTRVPFELVEIIADSLFYENVPSDGFSNYLPFETAFREMPFTIEADSATFAFTPTAQDLEPLPIGLYTYEIAISSEGEVVLTFRVD